MAKENCPCVRACEMCMCDPRARTTSDSREFGAEIFGPAYEVNARNVIWNIQFISH